MTQITAELLKDNGWREIQTGYLVIDLDNDYDDEVSKTRFGWFPETGHLVVGYGAWPRPVKVLTELLLIIQLAGFEKYSFYFEW